MKIIVLLSASLLGFGWVSQEAVKVPKTAVAVNKVEAAPVLEAPMMHVTLDTVEITVSGNPGVIAGNIK